jgi:hypothetical protein
MEQQQRDKVRSPDEFSISFLTFFLLYRLGTNQIQRRMYTPKKKEGNDVLIPPFSRFVHVGLEWVGIGRTSFFF